MKILLNITFDESPNKINKQVEVDENISLKDLGECIIVSMNDSEIPIYELEYGDKDFEVISGKGYGIIDDVGGIWGLEDIFDGKNTSWGKYNINDFD